MTRTQNYTLLTLDNKGSPEFTDITCRDLELNPNINIKFMSMETVNNKPNLLIVTKNNTKDIIIDESNKSNDKTVKILYNPQ